MTIPAPTRNSVQDLMKGIPGYLVLEEGLMLAKLAHEQVVIELGSFQGLSTRCMAPYCRRMVCIDHWHTTEGPRGYDPQAPSTRPIFEKNIETWKDKIQVVEMRTEEAGKLTWPLAGLVFHDAGHTYEAVKADLLAFGKYVKPGGYVAIHDYGRPEHPEVKPAVVDTLTPQLVWEFVTQVQYLGVYRRLYQAEKVAADSLASRRFVRAYDAVMAGGV